VSRAANNGLLRLVESFFREHLQRIRGASRHTVLSYRDSLRLFLCFVSDDSGRSVSALTLDDIEASRVLAFLDHLESVRGNSITTRNQRLAAIRGFVEHLLRHDPTRAARYGQILAIPTKKSRSKGVLYLEPDEVQRLLQQPDLGVAAGRRHHTLLLFLYNTGARISEALAVRVRDLHMRSPRQVRLHGKGGKDRICPLWTKTADALHDLCKRAEPNEAVFLNARGQPLSRDGAAYVLRKYAAAAGVPTSSERRVSPHVLRHSCAVALLQAGADVTVIRDYLGHASVATTNRYISTNLQMKREVLEAFWEHSGLAGASDSSWEPTDDVLAFLESL